MIENKTKMILVFLVLLFLTGCVEGINDKNKQQEIKKICQNKTGVETMSFALDTIEDCKLYLCLYNNKYEHIYNRNSIKICKLMLSIEETHQELAILRSILIQSKGREVK